MMDKKIKNLPKRIWLLFFSLYSTQYIGISFLSVALVLILRKNGSSLDKLSLIPLMSLPIAFKVLWAPFIDKHLKTVTGHYRNWLLAAQFMMMVCLLAIAFIDPGQQFHLVLSVVLFFSFTTATQDLALSGLICNIFEEHERYLISSVKSSGSMFGNIIGGGVVLLLYPYIDWKGCMLLLALILAFTWLQLWFFDEYQFGRNKGISEATDKNYWKNIISVWKGKKSWCTLLVIIPFGILPSYNLMSPALIDSGWSLPDIAILLKLFGSVISLAAIFLGTRLLKKLSRKQSLSFSIIFHACCLLLFIPISLGYNSAVQVYSSFFLYFISLPFVFISISTIIMDNVANSVAPATAYNAQTAIGFVFGFIVVSLSFYLAQMLGYFLVTTGSIFIAFISAILATRTIQNQSAQH
ncbi:MFS transporter [Salmonella enterica subsp. enterica serovar Newport]|nr:MFS transporter [Salmonella enterica subsp. enterica serovar Newport]